MATRCRERSCYSRCFYSTPITKEVIAFLEQYDPMNPATWERVRKVPLQKILPRVKVKKEQ
ncbi:LytB-like protein [Bacillus cereus G9241]|nr:LytB-like protein [Bacillus cereus G9241]